MDEMTKFLEEDRKYLRARLDGIDKELKKFDQFEKSKGAWEKEQKRIPLIREAIRISELLSNAIKKDKVAIHECYFHTGNSGITLKIMDT